jgi:hypothetical protein
VTPGATAPDWRELAAKVRAAPNVAGVSPYLEIEALAVRKPDMSPVRLRGIDPTHEGEVARITHSIIEGKLSDLVPGSDRVIIGAAMAQTSGCGQAMPSPSWCLPRMSMERPSRTCVNSRWRACSSPRCRTTTARC